MIKTHPFSPQVKECGILHALFLNIFVGGVQSMNECARTIKAALEQTVSNNRLMWSNYIKLKVKFEIIN